MHTLFYPYWLDKTPAKITITSGLNSDGTEKIIDTIEVKGRLNDQSIYTVNSDGQKVALEGIFYVGNDILPNISKITGEVTVGDRVYRIYRVKRPRNPNGTVCYTKLELI